jgi:hypothetical protein
MGTLAKVIAVIVKTRAANSRWLLMVLWGSFGAGAFQVIGTEQCGAGTRSASSGTGGGAGSEV